MSFDSEVKAYTKIASRCTQGCEASCSGRDGKYG